MKNNKEYYEWVRGFVDDRSSVKLTVEDMEAKKERSCGDYGDPPSDEDVEWFKKKWPDGAKYHELLSSFPEEKSDWMWEMEGP